MLDSHLKGKRKNTVCHVGFVPQRKATVRNKNQAGRFRAPEHLVQRKWAWSLDNFTRRDPGWPDQPPGAIWRSKTFGATVFGAKLFGFLIFIILPVRAFATSVIGGFPGSPGVGLECHGGAQT